VVLNIKFVFMLIKSVTSNNFLSFQSFFERENMKETYATHRKRMYLQTHIAHSVLQFSQRDVSICTSVVFYIFWCGIWGAHGREDL
jgi:hypothetical protein